VCPPGDGDQRVTLEDCLDAFIKPEKLTGVDCSTCNQLRDMSKRLSIHVLPPTLAFHLKRFQSSVCSTGGSGANGNGNGSNGGATSSSSSSSTMSNGLSKLQKNETAVVFPMDGLDLAKYVSIPCSCSAWRDHKKCACFTYILRAVVQHSGQLAGGHYISYVRYDAGGEPKGLWFKFDDAYVHPVTPEMVLDSEAYMLFYSKVPNHML
jgi:ubiquitin C-terminal hydrolase